MSILQPCPSRPLAICGLLFFEGLIDEGAQPGADVEVPLGEEALEAFPPGITVEGATPAGECSPRATVRAGEHSPVLHQRQKEGGRSLHFPPSCAAPRRAGRGGGHAMPTPHGALPHRIWEIRANPRPMRVSGNSLDHGGEGFAL